jgi:carboxyl-terminal processing protease
MGPMSTDADLLRIAFSALVSSAAPADPARAATAALAAASRTTALPEGFGGDVQRDAAWLAHALDGVTPPWPVIQAMAWSAGIPHTTVVPPAMRAAVGGMRTGTPPVEPGVLMHTLVDGRVVVSDVAPGCSADVAGIRAGDVVVSMEGEPVERPVARIIRLYRHPAGTEIPLQVLRSGEPLSVTMRLEPGRQSLVESRMLDGKIGLVFLRAFTTSEDSERDVNALVRRAASALQREAMHGLIVDLRSNPGGNSDAAAATAAALTAGDPMLSFRTPDGKETNVPRTGEPLALGVPFVVLVDDQTSSSAEMLALALREHAKARVVGRATAGALTLPAMTPLRDGFMLMTPGARSLGPVSRSAQDANRLAVDVDVESRTPEDFAAGRDAQLDAALALFR